MQVRRALQRLRDDIVPNPGKVDAARASIGRIRGRLGNSFLIADARWLGSHWRGTAIREASDVDLFVVLRRAEARHGGEDVSSDRLLDRVRLDLQARYANTVIRRSGSAVAIRFASNGLTVDVVPALFERFTPQSFPVYRIPDGRGGYILTSPQGQALYLEAKNQRTGGKLFPLVRYIKWWAACRAETAVAKGLYFELSLAEAGIAAAVMGYPDLLHLAFASLAGTRCRSVPDPLGLSGPIAPCETRIQQTALCEAAAHARDLARRAIDADAIGRWDMALALWARVFNRCVPF